MWQCLPAGVTPLANALLEVIADSRIAASSATHAAHHATPHGHDILLGHELLLEAPLEAPPGSEPALELEVANLVAEVARLANCDASVDG